MNEWMNETNLLEYYIYVWLTNHNNNNIIAIIKTKISPKGYQ